MTLPRFLRRSIRAKLMATILAPIIAALIFASVFFPARERALSFELGREQAKTLNEMLAFSVGSGMHGSDFELVQTAFDWAKDDPNVVYVALLDENAEALFEHNPHGLSVDLAAAVSWEEIVEDGSRLYAHTPILYAGTDYGHTVLVYSMGTALTRINWGLALTLIIGLVLALGAALAAGLLSRLIASRLVGLGRAARAVGDGELDAEIPSGSEDEVGTLAEAFRGMVVNIREARTELQTEKDAIEGKVRDAVAESEAERAYLEGEVDRLLTGIESFAEGDLTVTFNAGRDDAIGRLSSGLNRAITQVREMIGEVGRAIDSTAAASTDIGTTTAQLATAAHEQSRQAEEVAAAVEEMARTVSANASTATSTTQVAESNGQAAEEGGAVVHQTVTKIREIASVVAASRETIERLGASSEEVGKIVATIEDIADQTNLLALNAAIEAARAGEHGRGFAVVADEVRKLAERTTHATAEIGEMIGQIRQETADAVEAMRRGNAEVDEGITLADEARRALERIVEGANATVDMVGQIAAASEEQSTTSEQMARSVEKISAVSAEAAQGVGHIATSAEGLNQLTAELRLLVHRFRIDGSGIDDSASAPSFGDGFGHGPLPVPAPLKAPFGT